MSAIIETQESIGEWAEATFEHTERTIALHLLSEAVELCMGTRATFKEMSDVLNYTVSKPKTTWPPGVPDNSADVVILARALANFNGFDLEQEVATKMAVNRGRKWGERNVVGFREHVEKAGNE